MAKPSPLQAEGIFAGGVFPFLIFPPGLPPGGHFNPASSQTTEARNRVRNPDVPDGNPATLYEFDLTIGSLTLGGRKFGSLPMNVVLCHYGKIGTVVFRVDLTAGIEAGQDLTVEQLIELGLLVSKEGQSAIEVTLGSRTSFPSFLSLCDGIRALHFKEGAFPRSPKVIHPILFIRDIKGCAEVKDVVEQYPYELAALCNLSTHHLHFSKPRERKSVEDSEIHPFEYGLTYISRRCTLEIHTSSGLERSAGINSESQSEHDLGEWLDLAFMAEHAIAYYFFLRHANEMLDDVNHGRCEFSDDHSEDRIPAIVDGILARVRRRQQISRDLARFRTPSLKRRPFIQKTFALYDRALGSGDVEKSVEEKLKLLTQTIDNSYRWVQWGFALAISSTALVFTVVKLLSGRSQ